MASPKRVQWAQLKVRHRGDGRDDHRRRADFPADRPEQSVRRRVPSAHLHGGFRRHGRERAGAAERHSGRAYRKGEALRFARSEADRRDRHEDPEQISGSDSGRFEGGHQRRPICWATSTSTSPKARIPKHVEPGGEIQSLQTQDIPEILAQSSSLLRSSRPFSGRVDGLLTIVENGQGNIGKLIKDDTLYDRLNATAGEVRATGEGRQEQQRHHQPSALRRHALQRHPQADPAPRRHAGAGAAGQGHGRAS